MMWRHWRTTITTFLILFPMQSYGLTANKVWMELRSNGRFRVYVNYTIPELKQMREAWVEFSKKQDADGYFINLARGADFYLPDSKGIKFQDKNSQLVDPW